MKSKNLGLAHLSCQPFIKLNAVVILNARRGLSQKQGFRQQNQSWGCALLS